MGYPTYPEHPTRTVQRIYVASSWRNHDQPMVVSALRTAGFAVYDFRHPKPDEYGFQWSAIDPYWEHWTGKAYREALTHPIAEAGFTNDFEAMQWADTCVLLLPSGRSAHLEAGWMAGTGRRVYVLMFDQQEPELMNKLTTGICLSVAELITSLRHVGSAS